MANFTTSTIIHAPREEVWAALADIGSIHSWNPGVEHSHTTSEKGSGLGASRHCDLGGRNYLEEEVVEYDPGERLTMRVTESNLPFAHADIRFLLEPEETSTRVSVQPEYELKFGLVGTMMDRLFVRRSYEKMDAGSSPWSETTRRIRSADRLIDCRLAEEDTVREEITASPGDWVSNDTPDGSIDGEWRASVPRSKARGVMSRRLIHGERASYSYLRP